jgi:hypothetical protein
MYQTCFLGSTVCSNRLVVPLPPSPYLLEAESGVGGGPAHFGTTHIAEKVRKHTDYHCSTSPGGIRVIIFIFSQGKHYDIDNQIINE